MWPFNRLSAETMMEKIKLKYPKAYVKVFGYELYVVTNGLEFVYLGCPCFSIKGAIRSAYNVLKYN